MYCFFFLSPGSMESSGMLVVESIICLQCSSQVSSAMPIITTLLLERAVCIPSIILAYFWEHRSFTLRTGVIRSREEIALRSTQVLLHPHESMKTFIGIVPVVFDFGMEKVVSCSATLNILLKNSYLARFCYSTIQLFQNFKSGPRYPLQFSKWPRESQQVQLMFLLNHDI